MEWKLVDQEPVHH